LTSENRRLSAAIFNNDKFVEVVLALDDLGGTPTAQEVARHVGVNHDLAKAVLRRLKTADLVKAGVRSVGTRGPLPYEVQACPEWSSLVHLCRALARRT
jgi:hypothetical protein